VPVWRPRVGGHTDADRSHLERCLGQDQWRGGPWSVPASRIATEARPAIRTALRRFTLLGAAVAGNIDRWVLTHGEPHASNLLRTADGPRLVGWGGLALAPRERDLGEALHAADGDAPWYAYLEAGGRADALSADAVELFVLQRHLSVVVEQVLMFSRAHQDTATARHGFGELEDALTALVERYG
jgi:spectinomycin phosphotransferase